MATEKKANTEKGYSGAILSNNIKCHANDPFFEKKAEEAKIGVSNIVLPEGKKQ